jgi:thiamine biosynthesis lipoprotein
MQFLGEVANCAIATSTVDEAKAARFPGKVVSGNHYLPQHGVWTTTAPYTWQADALTKVASLAPVERKLALIAKLGGQLIYSRELNAA